MTSDLDPANKRNYVNGYVKVCGSWLMRLWKENHAPQSLTELAKSTTIFDACGAYDIKNDGNPIPKGSKFEAWKDALSFLEWYGIPHLEGFGIIIIDDLKDAQGNSNQFSLYTHTTTDPNGEQCFQKGLRLTTSIIVSVLSVLYLFTN